MTDTTRRKLLAGATTAAITPLAGCSNDPSKMELGSESSCIESVTVEEAPNPIFGGNYVISVGLSESCDTEYLLLLAGGKQEKIVTLGTAATVPEIEFDWESGVDYELVAVKGGRVDGGTHIDGTVIERVPLEAKS